jgi:hypothetical protein
MNNETSTTGAAIEITGAEIEGGTAYETAEVATMDNTTTTPAAKPARAKKAKKEPRNYPFLTKAQISAQIEGSFSFACEVIGILYDRQTKHEQDTSSTLNKNRRGFMSSHAVHGSRIAKELKAGVAPEALSDEDKARVAEIAPRYTKQLAEHFRAQAIAENPALAAQAACFFTDQG